MRVVAGEAKGRKLVTLDGNAVRPTPNRVKEALFDILQFRVEGRSFLDLFSGSGQIGIEALSRGAKRAVLVDNSRTAIELIKRNLENSGLASGAEPVLSDCFMFLEGTAQRFDLAFLDPPYRTGLLEKSLSKVTGVMNSGGMIICEHPSDELLGDKYGEFVKFRSYRYGKIMLESFQMINMPG